MHGTPNHAWRQTPYTRDIKHRAMGTRYYLLKLFPLAFMPFYAPKAPLKIGIYRDIKAAQPTIGGRDLHFALEDYCSGRSYLRGLIAGAERIDLNGIPAGSVTPEQAVRAAEQLEFLELVKSLQWRDAT